MAYVNLIMLNVIKPDWPAPDNIVAFTTTREGGASQAPYASLNLGDHVGDDTEHVASNRERLIAELNLPNTPAWLQQTHSTIAVEINDNYQLTEADASYTREPNQVCSVLTADCLPLLITNRDGTEVAAIHAGWRGLADGVIESCLNKLQSPMGELMVWLGPAMGPAVFEVQADVYDLFTQRNDNAEQVFTKLNKTKWLMDIYKLAQQRLKTQGIKAVYGGEHCTFSDKDKFFSYRRDGVTGRMASLIYITDRI
tara:strand:+ start:18346 stop:19107 length:762 start_codon:yes stop_codon:yes gene_type:complete